jgi:hypothetical protein
MVRGHWYRFGEPAEAFGRTVEGSRREPTYPEFHAALLAMAFKSTGKRGQQPDTTMLGNYLRRFKGRVIDGKKRGGEWWVEQVLAKPETVAAA